MQIKVCYALPEKQCCLGMEIAQPQTVGQVIDLSGILQYFPEIDLKTQKVGIFGKIVTLATLVQDADRVEIYRPLIVDPKLARQRRVDKMRQNDRIAGRKWRAKTSR